MNRSSFLCCRFAGLVLLLASTRIVAADSEAIAPKSCVFGDVNYFFRWSEKDQYEFTPAGQEGLQRWSDMVTVVLHRGIQDEESLAGLANGLLERYKSARGMILGTHSKPRTPQEPAEHFVAAVFPEPTKIEVAFARVLLVDGTACVLVYSHRDYGEKIGDRVSAWLKANGPRVEQQLMSWDTFPRPGVFSPAVVRAAEK